ncbi:MAG: ShlB/FhaC/HecB family hemolysin secretion/activation protein [Spongiibacteraceae bacterium]
MAIDMPPAMPPELADKAQIEHVASSQSAYIQAAVSQTQFRVFGNKQLSKSEVQAALASATSPSEGVIKLTRAYYDAGHLLVKLNYFRTADVVTVIVSEYTLGDVRGSEQVTAHFDHLADNTPLTVAELDRARVLADLQSRRAGLDYSISYQILDDDRVAMVFEEKPVEDHDATELSLELNNKGSRFLGRYFGMAGIKHHTKSGTELALNYSTAFADWGESRDGESLDQLNISVDHPFSLGLFGVEGTYVNYEREPQVTTSQAGSCLLGPLLCSPASATTTQVNIEAEISKAALRGQHVLASNPSHRLIVSERLEYIDSSIEDADTGTLYLDERYAVAAAGLNYTRKQRDGSGQFKGGLNVRAGFDEQGSLSHRAASTDPEVSLAARSGEFVSLQPSLSYRQNLNGSGLMLTASLNGQISNKQVPEQEQYVLGGMNAMSAYLPGVMVGDDGYHAKFEISQQWSWEGVSLRPAVFIEQGGSWYNDAKGVEGDEQRVSDAGVALNINIGKRLQTQFVAARNVSDDVNNEAALQRAEADFFWRLRLQF